MLPVTCVLTCESAAARHDIQIWNTAALNCMTSPMWFNKTQAATLRSRVSSLGFDSVDFIGSFLQPPTITSAATWLSGGPAEKQEGQGGDGGSSSLHSSCGSSQGWWRPRLELRWPHGLAEVINEVRYFFWWRWSSQQCRTVVSSHPATPPPSNLLQILYHMCSLTLTPSSCVTPAMLTKALPRAERFTYFFILSSEGEWNGGKNVEMVL